jgi:hypothetical protein
MDDTFIIWPYGPDTLIEYFSHISIVYFLDVWLPKIDLTLNTKVYRKPSHTGRHLNFASNDPPHVKSRVVQSHYNGTATICPYQQDRLKENTILKQDLLLNGYPQKMVTTYKATVAQHRSQHCKLSQPQTPQISYNF